MKKSFLFFAIAVTLFTGCGGGSKQVLNNVPQVGQIDTEQYTVVLTPKRKDNIIIGFSLTIRNKTNNDIEAVWDKTLHIDDGQTYGKFWFEGIPSWERNSPRSPSIVFSKSTLERDIWPSLLMRTRGKRIEHIPMDQGEHGVYLTMNISEGI